MYKQRFYSRVLKQHNHLYSVTGIKTERKSNCSQCIPRPTASTNVINHMNSFLSFSSHACMLISDIAINVIQRGHPDAYADYCRNVVCPVIRGSMDFQSPIKTLMLIRMQGYKPAGLG